MDHSPGRNPSKKDFECEAEYVPVKFVAGLYNSLTGDDKRYQLHECYKKAKTDMSALNNLSRFISRKYFDDEDIIIDYSELRDALVEIYDDTMAKCPNVDTKYFSE